MQALADLKAKERDLSEKSDLVQVLTDDRDRAMATLKQHGLVIDHNVEVWWNLCERPPLRVVLY